MPSSTPSINLYCSTGSSIQRTIIQSSSLSSFPTRLVEFRHRRLDLISVCALNSFLDVSQKGNLVVARYT